ncbi:MAG TPA: hypothetical protein VM103_00885, partial [Candidatus Paceibacterota bacterium]|nr:hypothetical protein [Candidatus Paceibacterota bacterium]
AAEHSLFSMRSENREAERGRIYHDVLKRSTPEEEAKEEPIKAPKEKEREKEKEEPIVTAKPNKQEEAPKPPVVEEEDESWGAIPAFLRRHKK